MIKVFAFPLQVVILSWVYGFDRTFDNLRDMGIGLNKTVRGYWMAVWVVLTPIASVVSVYLFTFWTNQPNLFSLFFQGVFIFTMTDIGRTQFGDYVFPAWADAFGWFLGSCTLIPFPIFAVYQLHKNGWVSYFSCFFWLDTYIE